MGACMKKITMIRLAALALFLLLLLVGKNMLWLAVFGLALLGTPLYGRFYCGYICPMNTTMRWTKGKKAFSFTKLAPYLPWITLGGSLLVMVFLRKLLKIDFPILIFWWAFAILASLFLHPAFFHNELCPFSAPLRTLAQFTKKGVHVRSEQCIQCGQCVEVCPAQAITQTTGQAAVIDVQLCHQCQDCVAQCPTHAISVVKLKAR